MDDTELDRAVVTAVFEQAGLRGWREVSLVEAARDAELDLERVRARFPKRSAVLLRFGVIADQAALASAGTEGTARDRLFDMIMGRFDALQRHRAGVLALLSELRTDPITAVLLYYATLRSMVWLLEGAGIPATGIKGQLRVHGVTALWLYCLRAWERDESADMAGTMKAVDEGLARAMQAERGLPGYRADLSPDVPPPPAGTDSFAP